MRVLGLEQRDSFLGRRAQRERPADAHRGEQRIGHLDAADAAAFRFDVHRSRRIESAECVDELSLERLLRRLRLARQIAQQRPAMTRDPLEVEGLRANSGEGGEETAFARACEAADHNVGEALRNAGELRDDVAPVCTIAALELHRTPADFVQHLRERPTALAASPAVHQRAPLARQLRECGFEHRGDVARNDRGAELTRSERRACVQCPNPRSLGIIEHRMIRRQRDMILGELCGAADVDAVRIFGQCRHGDTAHARMQHALRAH